MRTIVVDPGPPLGGFDTPEEAIADTERRNATPQAIELNARLAERTIEQLSWAEASCEIRVSGADVLHIQAKAFSLETKIDREPITVAGGSSVVLQFGAMRVTFDPVNAFSCLVGSQIERVLFVDRSLLVYARGNAILWLHALRSVDGGELLYACFGQ